MVKPCTLPALPYDYVEALWHVVSWDDAQARAQGATTQLHALP